VTGPVSVRIEGDEATALTHVRAAKAFLGRIQELRAKNGVSTFAGQYPVDENTYIYALTSGPINIVQIVTAPAAVPLLANPAIEGTEYPFLGGVVFNGIIKKGVLPNTGVESKFLSTFAPTARTQTDMKLAEGKQNIALLATFPYITDLQRSARPEPYSQYTMLKPTMFSGSMKFVVQLVMSYGKQKITMTTKDATPAYISRVASKGFEVMYDYRFSRTHGIVFGSDGTPWLTEISLTNGVIIMPLPRFSYTMPKKDKNGNITWPYYTQMEKQERTEIIAFLDLFGGLATGESFPTDISGGIAKGTIVQLLKPEDLQKFYDCTAYSSAMGWAFDRNGTQAHNTAYRFDEDSGVFLGLHYRIKLTIGEYKPENLKAKPTPKPIAAISATTLHAGTAALASTIEQAAAAVSA